MTSDDAGAQALPRPFYDDPWPAALRPDVHALWQWHHALRTPDAPALDGADLTAFFEVERAAVEAGAPVRVVPEAVRAEAYRACRAHRLPLALLAEQVTAARHFTGPVRFANSPEVNAFIQAWIGPHARLLAHMADAAHSWQVPMVNELAAAFFWVRCLVMLPRDLARDWLFIPEDDLATYGVSVAQLREGRRDEALRRLLWKQAIRARDAFAQGEKLVLELPRRYANGLKRYWLGGLEVLHEVERRDYDLWSKPVTLSAFYRLQVRFQARFGRTTFRSR